MAINAKEVGGGGGKDRVEQPQLEAGVYPGRLVQVIDLGLQPQRPYQGQDKPPAPEVMFTYELVDTFMVDEEGNEIEDKPRWVSETLPLYNLKQDKAKSTQRYNALDPQGQADGDFGALASTPVNITLVINQKGEKVYTNVAGIAAMRPRDAEKCPPLVNEPKVFDLDNPDVNVFGSLPEWIQTKIKGNLNYAGSKLEALLGGAKPAEKKEAKKPAKQVDPQEQEADGEDRPW